MKLFPKVIISAFLGWLTTLLCLFLLMLFALDLFADEQGIAIMAFSFVSGFVFLVSFILVVLPLFLFNEKIKVQNLGVLASNIVVGLSAVYMVIAGLILAEDRFAIETLHGLVGVWLALVVGHSVGLGVLINRIKESSNEQDIQPIESN